MRRHWRIGLALLLVAGSVATAHAAGGHDGGAEFPPKLDGYDDAGATGIGEILLHRIAQEPFNLIGTLIFFCAIVHTLVTGWFRSTANQWERAHQQKIREGEVDRDSRHLWAGVFRFLGMIETTFGLWAVVLFWAIVAFYGWNTAVDYVAHGADYTEPMFVVVIMILAASRPILKLCEQILYEVSSLFGSTLKSRWLTILICGPLLSSLITEPAAMTICALLLANEFYEMGPSQKLKYATIGLLFVNISAGGTLTNFATPPVIMVSAVWGWDIGFMFLHFGWKAALGIVISTGIYYFFFREELRRLEEQHETVQAKQILQDRYVRWEDLHGKFDDMEHMLNDELGFADACGKKLEEMKARLKSRIAANLSGEEVDPELFEEAFEQRFEEIRLQEMRRSLPALLPEEQRPPYRDPNWNRRNQEVPLSIMFIHMGFMAWIILNIHSPALFLAGLLVFVGFASATAPFQNRLDLRPPLLVGFFLAGFVVHGQVQAWWIAPVLNSLSEVPLMLGATVLTAFTDNVQVAYLSTLVPGFAGSLRYAVVAGAVAGGGLTVIANAPNPAGQAILRRYFENDGISPLRLFGAAILPTLVIWLCFWLLPG